MKYPAVSGAATGASYQVSYSAGTATVTKDQTKNTGTWVALGKWAFNEASGGQSVTLSQGELSVLCG